jgi:AraC-like DNA-binding protein
MKPRFQKILLDKGFSFIARKLNLPHFSSDYHFHPEYEIKYVIRSRGKRIVGSSIENFKEGDLVMIGPNIPHFWKNDPEYYETDQNRTSAFLIMFPETCLGAEFFSLAEMTPVKDLLQKARGGINFPLAQYSMIPVKLQRLLSCEGPLRILLFLDILIELANSEAQPLLSEESISGFKLLNHSSQSINRLNKVHEYVLENFQKRIKIEEVAAKANMTSHAFCKYFKKSTKKTFMTFLNELRICHAKKFLIESDYSISEICYASGFENMSYFNRKFKELVEKTPKEYRRDIVGLNLPHLKDS